MLKIFHAFLCGFNFSWRRLLCLFYKAMQKNNDVGLSGEIEDTGDVRGKTNSQFPNVTLDMLDIGFF